jgi:hypothetical protein
MLKPDKHAMTYLEAKMRRDAIEADVSRLSAALQSFPTGPMGLTPDATKALPEYRIAKIAFDAAFERSRRFNGRFVKAFAKEIRADRLSRRVAQVVGG